jgi:hypothetical protein
VKLFRRCKCEEIPEGWGKKHLDLVRDELAMEERVQYLIDYMDNRGILPEHYFCFPDGWTVFASAHGPLH